MDEEAHTGPDYGETPAHDLSAAEAGGRDPVSAAYDKRFNGGSAGYASNVVDGEKSESGRAANAQQLAGSEQQAGALNGAASQIASNIPGSREASDSINLIGNGYRGKHRKPSKIDAVRDKVMKRRALVIGVGAGSGVGIVVLIILIFFLGQLIIPNFAQNMIAWDLARVTRETIASDTEVDATELALSNTDDATYQATEAAATDTVDQSTKESIINTINKYRPQKVVDTLQANGKIQYNETEPSGLLHRTSVKSITINGTEIEIPRNTTTTLEKLINPFDYMKRVFQSNKAIKVSLADVQSETFRGSNTWLRNKAANIVNQRADIKRFRWTKKELDEDANNTPDEAAVEEEQVAFKRATDDGAAEAVAAAGASGEEGQAATEDDAALQKCIEITSCTEKLVKSNGAVPDSVVSILNKIFNPSIFTNIVKVIGPTYAIAAPLCMIYQASLVNSAGLINANVASTERTGYDAISGSQQQEKGDVNGNAVGAFNDHINGEGVNNISNANVLKKASGQPVDTTQSGVNPEADGTGGYSGDVFDFLGAGADSALRSVIKPACSALDNVWTGLGIGAAFLVIPGVSEAFDGVASPTLSLISQRILSGLTDSVSTMFSKTELLKLAGVAGATVAGGYIAKYIALQNLGYTSNGLARNQSYTSQAEAGVIAYGNDVDRQQNDARALTPQQVAQTKALDAGYISQQEQTESAYQRYLNINNPTSLATDLAVDVYARTNTGSLATMIQSVPRLLNPLTTFAGLFGIYQNKMVAAAAATADTSDYGLVQFGWTPIEENAYENIPTYGMIPNQIALTASGEEQQIDTKYGKCFSETMGDMLANGDVVRDQQGNVIADQGLCAPDNLGPTSALPDGTLVFTTPESGMVFRYRVAKRNENALDDQINDSSVTQSDAD